MAANFAVLSKSCAKGVLRACNASVAVLGASSFTYAEATWTQTLPDWIGSHVRMFRFFSGVPRLIVPDNLKSGVSRASFYDPEINRSSGMMASHFGVGILLARPQRLTAKVENGVRFAQSCILGGLRKQTFFSLTEANAAFGQALDRINDHVMRRLDVCRRHLFETMERPALANLPAQDYEFAEWRFARVSTDYHIEFERYFYSVRTTSSVSRWMAASAGSTPERFQRWCASIGPQTASLVIAIFSSRTHPEQGFRTCLGILRLFRDIDRDRAEAVAARAVEVGGLNCKNIASLISSCKATKPSTEPAAVVEHATLRGPGYFHKRDKKC